MPHKSRVKALERKRSIDNNKVVLYETWGECKPVKRHCEGETTVITWEQWLAIENDDSVEVVSLI